MIRTMWCWQGCCREGTRGVWRLSQSGGFCWFRCRGGVIWCCRCTSRRVLFALGLYLCLTLGCVCVCVCLLFCVMLLLLLLLFHIHVCCHAFICYTATCCWLHNMCRCIAILTHKQQQSQHTLSTWRSVHSQQMSSTLRIHTSRLHSCPCHLPACVHVQLACVSVSVSVPVSVSVSVSVYRGVHVPA